MGATGNGLAEHRECLSSAKAGLSHNIEHPIAATIKYHIRPAREQLQAGQLGSTHIFSLVTSLWQAKTEASAEALRDWLLCLWKGKA
jgi:hypothetical protein